MSRNIRVSINPRIEENENEEVDAIIDGLEDNIGKVITVFTQSGGCSGRGFTGLLTEVNDRFIRLVTSLPSAPRHPFGHDFDFDFDSDFRHCCRCSRFGTTIIIPIEKIVSFVFNQI